MAESKSSQDKQAKQADSPQPKSDAEVAAEKQAAADKAAADEKAKKQAAFEKSEKVPVEKKEKGNYVPAPGTEKDYHALIEVKNFDKESGERTSKPRVQIFSPKAWRGFEQNAIGLGYHVDILHDPTGEYPVVGKAKAIAEAKKAAKK